MRVKTSHGATAIGIHRQLVTVMQRQRHSVLYLHLHRAVQHGQPANPVIATHADLRLAHRYPSRPEVDMQGARMVDAQGKLALDQPYAMLSEVQVHCRRGVHLQHAAICQAHTASLTNRRAQIGAPCGQRQLPAQQPTARHRNGQGQPVLEHGATAGLCAPCHVHDQPLWHE
ncbi:hypothetical protein D3C80_1440130 [compost metagenome]